MVLVFALQHSTAQHKETRKKVHYKPLFHHFIRKIHISKRLNYYQK